MLDNFAPGEGDKTISTRARASSASCRQPRRRLKPLVADAQKDVERLRTNLEAWYDDTMARVSGWYKRKTQIILIVIGIVLVPRDQRRTRSRWPSGCGRTTRSARRSSRRRRRSAPPRPPPRSRRRQELREKLNKAADEVDKVVKVGIPMGWRGEAVPHGAG